MFTRSKIRKVFTALFILMAGQFLTIPAQEAVGALDRDRITAGQTFEVKIHFDTAPSYGSTASVIFDPKPQNGNINSIVCNGSFNAGSTDVTLTCRVPIDQDGGTYAPREAVFLGAPPGASKGHTEKLSLPNIEILAVQDTNVYPSEAVGIISLDQQQILESGAAKVDTLLDELNTKIDNNAAETPDIQLFLSDIAKAGLKELETSRLAYLKTLKSGTSEPIFFEDFARLYNAYLYEIHDQPSARADNSFSVVAHFKTVQATSNQTVTVHPNQLADTLGPLASKLADLLGNHLAAFTRIGKSGSTTFTISLHSSPPGASISYKRIGENYQDYSKVTDVDQATFPYAMWTFKFTLGKCEVVKTPNPYIEQSPNLNTAMQHCLTK